jgi:hypothetical protein
MATPTPGEPFSEAAGEAVQTAVMATRLVLAIADAVRRHQQKKNKGKGEELPPADEAVSETTEGIKSLIPSDISAALMREADWPQMAQQLMALRNAGVDLEQFLPRVGDIAVSVQEQVAANEARVAREHTESEGKPVREHLARLGKDVSWEQRPGPQLGSRLVQAATDALRRPVGDTAESRVQVNTTAARAHSATMGPTNGQARGAAPAEPGVTAHRQSGPAKTGGRTR